MRKANKTIEQHFIASTVFAQQAKLNP